MSQQPSVGRIVHYVSYGTPGGEYTSQCRAAVIAGVPATSDVDGRDVDQPIDLAVLNPTGLFFKRCERDDGAGQPGDSDCPTLSDHGNPLRYCGCGWSEPHHRGGTWHWPERT